MTTLFISDLHLDRQLPEIGAQFKSFMRGEARDAEALYILGDLFEVWVGDDDPNPHYAEMKAEIREVVDSGVPVFFMHGNRDFLIGARFAEETGVRLLKDPAVVDLYGEPVLLAHGDAYCTDDTDYQAMRRMLRDPDWQDMMLRKPLDERLAIARSARKDSQARNANLAESIMDVNPEAIETALGQAGVRTLLHGHTHRPAVHELSVNGQPAKRIVLGDWYDQGSVVRWDREGPRLEAMPRQR